MDNTKFICLYFNRSQLFYDNSFSEVFKYLDKKILRVQNFYNSHMHVYLRCFSAESGNKSDKSKGAKVYAPRGKIQETTLHPKRDEAESRHHVVV